jgi:CRISPR-associated endonuclease Csn1
MKNDSFNNLVISEAAINPKPYKGSMLARNFIAQFGGKDGKEYEINGNKYFILGENEYESYCKETFKHQKAKLKNLLATEVPEDFIDRQLNDTRYIGRKLSELLASITKSENGIIFTGGAITSELKKNWGLNKVWKEIIKPRFERLEEITGNTYIINDTDEHGNPVYHFNVKENQGLNTKRIDHRHHALDALIVATTTREHIRYLNTLKADTDDEIKKIKQSLVKGKIRDFKQPWKNFTKEAKDELEKLIVSFKTNNKIISQPKNRTAYYKMVNDKPKKEYKPQKANKKWMAVRKSMFKEPLGVVWLKEVKEVGVLDAFKIHIEKKLINSDREKRKTASYVYDKQARQIIDDIVNKSNFAIDEQEELLKDINSFLKKNSQKVATDKTNKNGEVQYKTVFKINGVEYEKIKVAHFVSYKTKRMALTKKEYVEKLTIEKMKNDFPYFSFINKQYFDSLDNEKQNILQKAGFEISEMKYQNAFNKLFLEHILEYSNDAKEAFSAEGVEKLNKKALENPKIGKEIKSVTRLDGTVDIEDMFNGGFYETDKGSNMYFVMYENQQTKERSDFRSIATHKAIEKIVKGDKIAEDKEGFDKIILSPGDLVYMSTKEEREEILKGTEIEKAIDWNNQKHISNSIYKMTDTTQGKCLFVPHRISSSIIDNEELGSGNKSARAWDGKVEYVANSKGKLTREDSGTMIKETCIKLKIDRLGNISKV